VTRISTTSAYEELAYRKSGGVEVGLFWAADEDKLLIAVRDEQTGAGFEFEIDGPHALDAFEHPYAYAARRDGLLLAA
jgi:hypothetical protein